MTAQKKQELKFKRQLAWFHNKLYLNNNFIVKVPQKVLDEFHIIFRILFANYKYHFKTKSRITIHNYVFSWSYEQSDFKRAHQQDADMIVFRVKKKTTHKSNLVYRCSINLNK